MKKILITGCNGNLASTIIPLLVKLKFKVFGCDIHNIESIQTKSSIELGLSKYIKCDLSNEIEISELINNLKKRDFPEYLINNAAIDFVPNNNKEEDGLDISNFDKLMHVNIKAPILLSKYFIDYWKSKTINGNIINISSIYSELSPDPNLYQKGFVKNILYGVTKSALNSITKQLAVLTAKNNIRVNAILFAGVESKFQNKEFVKKYKSRIPIGRLMYPNEIIEPLLFLMSQDNTYTTGTLLKVDGGYSLI
jgi:NAD(P)-dependent dehydrogenase (short-subunit alcohol dehydrogenase family)